MTDVTALDHATSTNLLWTSGELLERGSWTQDLHRTLCDELLAFAARVPSATEASFTYAPEQWPRLALFAQQARRHLQSGDGVLRITGLEALDLSDDHLRCFYVAFGTALGEPLLGYGRLYPVTDRGVSHKQQGVPISMTNAETCFHTDSSSVDLIPDFVGLLCEQPSNQGGDSLVSNALRAHEALSRNDPELLAILEAPMIRDVVTPGKEKTHANLVRNRFPVFSASDRPGGLLFRYMRYWIETGQDRAGAALQPAQVAALDHLDELLQHAENVVRFSLKRGDMLWVNNRIFAHNRTGYCDAPDNVRRLQRMWIQTRK